MRRSSARIIRQTGANLTHALLNWPIASASGTITLLMKSAVRVMIDRTKVEAFHIDSPGPRRLIEIDRARHSADDPVRMGFLPPNMVWILTIRAGSRGLQDSGQTSSD